MSSNDRSSRSSGGTTNSVRPASSANASDMLSNTASATSTSMPSSSRVSCSRDSRPCAACSVVSASHSGGCSTRPTSVLHSHCRSYTTRSPTSSNSPTSCRYRHTCCMIVVGASVKALRYDTEQYGASACSSRAEASCIITSAQILGTVGKPAHSCPCSSLRNDRSRASSVLPDLRQSITKNCFSMSKYASNRSRICNARKEQSTSAHKLVSLRLAVHQYLADELLHPRRCPLAMPKPLRHMPVLDAVTVAAHKQNPRPLAPLPDKRRKETQPLDHLLLVRHVKPKHDAEHASLCAQQHVVCHIRLELPGVVPQAPLRPVARDADRLHHHAAGALGNTVTLRSAALTPQQPRERAASGKQSAAERCLAHRWVAAHGELETVKRRLAGLALEADFIECSVQQRLLAKVQLEGMVLAAMYSQSKSSDATTVDAIVVFQAAWGVKERAQ
eukprot:m.281867 g.281867  ORF g.281867 m.281867 type:complete len:446 (-) comp11107_c0_seq68:63-1400(-)